MEQASAKWHIHIGMRIVKTVIAVFLCGLMAYLRDASAIYSMIAALICLQNSTGKTIESSMNRALGTVIGGAAGVLVVFLLDWLGLLNMDMVRYTVLALMLIPLIELTLLIKRPAISAFVCVVFLCVAINPEPDNAMGASVVYAVQRLFETLVGVGVACMIDLFFPYLPEAQKEEPQTSEETLPQPEESPPAEGEELPELPEETHKEDAP